MKLFLCYCWGVEGIEGTHMITDDEEKAKEWCTHKGECDKRSYEEMDLNEKYDDR